MDRERAGVTLLEGVASLVDKSLLRWEEGPDGEPRYLMLETVREFGLEQLAASGDEKITRGQHAAWCLALAERAAPELLGRSNGGGPSGWIGEHANQRAALAWLTERGEAEPELRLGGALFVFWFLRGHLHEGTAWLEQALSGAPRRRPTARPGHSSRLAC